MVQVLLKRTEIKMYRTGRKVPIFFWNKFQKKISKIIVFSCTMKSITKKRGKGKKQQQLNTEMQRLTQETS